MLGFVYSCWFGKNPLRWFLVPFSLVYGIITNSRRFFYKSGIFKIVKSAVPVVVVGNIMIGGNGKTPVVIALAEHFKRQGLKVGIVSRGYGAHPDHYPFRVNADMKASEAGDEPRLIKLRTGVPVIIDPDRAGAVKEISGEVDIIISDDGLQHYSMGRDVEIIVIDGKRRFGNGWLLPTGPLREKISRLKSADFLINNGGEHTGEYSMNLHPSTPYPLSGEKNMFLPKGAKVSVMAGIGDPTRFYCTVEALGYQIMHKENISDHGVLSTAKFTALVNEYPLLITEKDMVKYIGQNVKGIWVVRVDAELPEDFYNALDKNLAQKIHKRVL